MQNNKFYITTPIYYVNDKPHIGHAYTTILADVLAGYHRLLGEDTFYLTGTDEHGQKVEKAARENKITPIEQCNRTVVRFKELWARLEITNDDFIRTTEERHEKVVQDILQDLYDRRLIYKAEYKGNYCVPCEMFFKEKDLDEDEACPNCGRRTEDIIESNYFFKMSQYQDWLIDYIKSNPEFIQPAFRANETLGFLKKPLEDLCISRPKSRLSWGIELPFDSDYVCYVWFDALVNYISTIGYGTDMERFKKWWPVNYHLIGKDILTTHTVYWPTMLKAMGVEMPKTIFAHGWWLVGEDKMSKSSGNVVNPMKMTDKYGVDPFRFFLMSEMSLGQDASFTEEAFIRRYNSNLANDLGNLVSRILKMTQKEYDGKIPVPSEKTELEVQLEKTVIQSVREMADATHQMRIEQGIESVLNSVRACNRYLERTAPWKLAKSGERRRLGTVLYSSAELLRIVSGLLQPIMPAKMQELRQALGIKNPEKVNVKNLGDWGELEPGSEIKPIKALFMRIDCEKIKKAQSSQKKKKNKDSEKKEKSAGIITIDEFFRSKLKTAEILKAEKVEGKDKLMKLEIEIGSEKRQIVAGIAQYYKAEELMGRTIAIVSNLKPAKICGIESNGMLLAAKSKNGLKLLSVDGEVENGADIG